MRQDEGPEDEESTCPRPLSKALIQTLSRERGQSASHASTSLYLHGCRLSSIQGLEDFPNLRVLHLEQNCISSCQGLGHLTCLRVLHLENNSLSSLEGLAGCSALVQLNISSNPLGALQPGCLPASLLTLHASGIGLHSPLSVQALAQDCPALQVLDIQHNPGLTDGGTILPVLCSVKSLRVLYAQGCGFARTQDYRRTLVSGLPSLHYLDSLPVDEVERAGAAAWLRGGREAEQAARLACRDEQRRALRRTQVAFAVERAKRRVAKALGENALDPTQSTLLTEDTDTLVRRLVDVPDYGLPVIPNSLTTPTTLPDISELTLPTRVSAPDTTAAHQTSDMDVCDGLPERASAPARLTTSQHGDVGLVQSDEEWWASMLALRTGTPRPAAGDAVRTSHAGTPTRSPRASARGEGAVVLSPRAGFSPQSRSSSMRMSHGGVGGHAGVAWVHGASMQWVSALRGLLNERPLSHADLITTQRGVPRGIGLASHESSDRSAEQHGQQVAGEPQAPTLGDTVGAPTSPTSTHHAEHRDTDTGARTSSESQAQHTSEPGPAVQRECAVCTDTHQTARTVDCGDRAAQAQRECAVCTDTLQPGQLIVSLPCHHIFHASCVKRWIIVSIEHGTLDMTNTTRPAIPCPLCRAPLHLPTHTPHTLTSPRAHHSPLTSPRSTRQDPLSPRGRAPATAPTTAPASGVPSSPQPRWSAGGQGVADVAGLGGVGPGAGVEQNSGQVGNDQAAVGPTRRGIGVLKVTTAKLVQQMLVDSTGLSVLPGGVSFVENAAAPRRSAGGAAGTASGAAAVTTSQDAAGQQSSSVNRTAESLQLDCVGCGILSDTVEPTVSAAASTQCVSDGLTRYKDQTYLAIQAMHRRHIGTRSADVNLSQWQRLKSASQARKQTQAESREEGQDTKAR